MLRPDDFFDLSDFDHRGIFSAVELVWESLAQIKSYLNEHLFPNVPFRNGNMLSQTSILWEEELIDKGFEIVPGDAAKGTFSVIKDGQELIGASILYAGVTFFDPRISIGKGCIVEPGVLIKGPTIIGDMTEVRQGAYIRGNCLIGNRCVVGHSTEAKTTIMLNGAKAGHFAYLGDSILGNDVNLGAGTKLANFKIIKAEIKLRAGGKVYNTGLRKLGAILGDQTETGCNSVTSPGTLLGKKSLVYPCVNVPGGYYPDRSAVAINVKNVLSVRELQTGSQ